MGQTKHAERFVVGGLRTCLKFVFEVCVRRTTKHQFTVWVNVCLAVTCHLRFWQNDRDLLCDVTCYCGNMGVERLPKYMGVQRLPKYELAQKVDPGEEKFARRSCRDSNPRSFDHESGALTTERSQLNEVLKML